MIGIAFAIGAFIGFMTSQFLQAWAFIRNEDRCDHLTKYDYNSTSRCVLDGGHDGPHRHLVGYTKSELWVAQGAKEERT